MADTSEPDGVENKDHETNTSRQSSKQTEVSGDIPLATSLPRRVKMDGDDDGAPTSTHTSPSHQKAPHDDGGADGNRTSVISFDSSAESTPRKTVPKRSSAPSTPQAHAQDLSVVDMKMSWDGSVSGGSAKGETTDAGLLADPVKIAKEREKEERVRQARERLMEERRKKLEELREQQRIAQENREKQLEMRRRKIEDLRRRDSERRAAVEERRKMKEDVERARRESILQKAEERVARYEAWKAGGRKGVFGDGAGSSKNLSVSMSVLYRKQSPEFSSMSFLSPGTTLDRSKSRPVKKDEKAVKDKDNLSEKAQKAGHKIEDEKETDKDGDKDKKSRVSLSFYDRLATPKYSKKDGDPTSKVDLPPKKDPTAIRVQFAGDDDGDQDGVNGPERSSIREKPEKPAHKDVAPKQHPTAAKDTSRGVTPVSGPTTPVAPAARGISPGRKEKPASSTPRVTPPPSSNSTPTHTPSVPRASSPPPQSAADDGGARGVATPAQDISAEEYKARLAEKRRQARERAEKEAEEERRRQEEALFAEQERLRKEEEEQRRLEEEAAEARKAEEERLQKAIQAEEKRRKEEAEKLEVDKKAKEEADKKAREEAEKLEKEKQEKSKREEEERQARKKKLEMIMKRVKPETQAEGTLKTESPKSVSSSPNLSQVNSSQNSPDEQDKPVGGLPQDTPSDEESLPPVGSAVEVPNAAMTTSFILDTDDDSLSTSTVMTASFIRSASSNDILESGDADEGHEARLTSSAATTPSRHEDKGLSSEPSSETKSKFKSPLLQQLVEKKGSDSPSGGPKFKSPLLQNLLGKTKAGARMGMSSSTGDLNFKDSSSGNGESPMSTSTHMTSHSSFTKELSHQDRHDEDKDEDTTDAGRLKSFHTASLTNGMARNTGDSHFTKSSADSSPAEAGGKFAMSSMSDSALGASIEPHMEREFTGPGVMSQSYTWNGEDDHAGHSMEDSSISLHSIAESLTTSGFVFDPVSQSEGTIQDDRHFEDLLDLRDSKTSSLVSGAPILAFGENRRQDATESLS